MDLNCDCGTPDRTTATEPFRLEVKEEAECCLLVLTGEILLSAAKPLHEQALRLLASATPIEIDWSGAERLTPGSLQVLLSLAAEVERQGRSWSVTGDSPEIRHMLEIAGLSNRFPTLERGNPHGN